MRRKAEDAAQTRTALVDAGLLHFAESGYAAAGLDVIAADLGLTRGAIYHHFRSKRDFFAAVVERGFVRLRDRVVAASAEHGDGWDGLHAGCDAFLAAATDSTFRRICLVDGPGVLGWEAWREIDQRTTAGSLSEGLNELKEDGILMTHVVDALTVGLSGAMNELSLWVATQTDAEGALARARVIVHGLLEAWRRPE